MKIRIANFLLNFVQFFNLPPMIMKKEKKKKKKKKELESGIGEGMNSEMRERCARNERSNASGSTYERTAALDDAADWMRWMKTIPSVELTTWRLVAVEKDAQVVVVAAVVDARSIRFV